MLSKSKILRILGSKRIIIKLNFVRVCTVYATDFKIKFYPVCWYSVGAYLKHL